jgi:pilus assembly protein Flp/PilA
LKPSIKYFSNGEKMNKLFSSNKQENGQGLVEYAIILALIAIVVIAVMGAMGDKISCAFQGISNSLDGTEGSCGDTQDPATVANATYAPHCANRGYPSGLQQTWPAGDVVVYMQNDGNTYTRYSDDPFFTNPAYSGWVIENYGTIPAGTTVTCP